MFACALPALIKFQSKGISNILSVFVFRSVWERRAAACALAAAVHWEASAGTDAVLSHAAVAGTPARPGHPDHHGAAVSHRGYAEPRCHADGGFQGQPGVFLPVALVSVLVPSEFLMT